MDGKDYGVVCVGGSSGGGGVGDEYSQYFLGREEVRIRTY